ncbi:MAG: carboxymuconolactone decarboxylase family protein, partial [Desulfobacteraceae bacterium]
VKSRQIATIAALTTLGNAKPQLKFHIDAALNIGITPAQVIEVIYITTIFAGFPAGLNGISAAGAVFEDRGVAVEIKEPFYEKGSRRERGLQALALTSANSGQTVLDSLKDIAPDMGKFILDFSYGDVISRKIISPKWKEIAMISSAIARGNMQPQLKVHLKAALNVGCSRQEIIETIYQMAVYAGFPAALNGLSAAREVFKAAK